MRLHAEGLSFAYRRHAVPVLESLDVTIEPGMLTVLVGPSGSGKSTLLYLLALMMSPTGGRILWDGIDASRLPDGDRSALRARRAGFVFQDALLDPSRTVLDNVCQAGLPSGMSPDRARRSALTLLDRFGVGERARHRPGEISGGQAQRVALCRALLGGPDVLFGDEPTGNLDQETGDLVWSALSERARAGASVVLATHDLRRAATADRVVDLASPRP